MSKVTIELSRDEATRVLAFLGAAEGPANAPAVEAEKPARKPRASKKEETKVEEAPQLPAAGPSLADMLGGIGGTAVETPKPAVTQKDLIAAFVKLGNDKGIDAVKALLGKYSVATVTAIPQDKWAEVVEAAKV